MWSQHNSQIKFGNNISLSEDDKIQEINVILREVPNYIEIYQNYNYKYYKGRIIT